MVKYRFLWCSECLNFTKHSVEDLVKENTQIISCIECDSRLTNQIINKRVKVEKEFHDKYVRSEQ